VRRAASGLFAKRRVVQKPILRDVTARFKPGTMTLVLGQPGSGKSTMLKLAAARFPLKDKRLDVQGEVTYSGASIMKNQTLYNKAPQLASYVEQQDTHFPTLTTKETLKYAHEMIGSELYRHRDTLLIHGTPEDNAVAVDAVATLEKRFPEVVIEQLGLQNCADTRLGNAMIRGVSGGERKRVTTGEMAFGLKPVSLMDEISTGLDSAATFDIIYEQRETARKLGRAVVISLLQPSPEVFELFDDVIVLNAGHVLYYGPTIGVDDYFLSLGFHRPKSRDVADFLLDLATEEQRVYEARSRAEITDGNVINTSGTTECPRTPEAFDDAYKHSGVYQALLDEMANEASDGQQFVSEHLEHTPEFHQSLWDNIRTLTRREMLLSMRNTDFIVSRVVMVLLMGLIYGSLYFQAVMTNIQLVMGVLFSVVLFLMLGQTAQIATFLDAREVFYKHRGSNMAQTVAYVMASCLRQLPLAIAEAVVFGAIVYWMVGFQASIERFLVFEALLACTILVYVSWFFLLSSVSPNVNIMFPIVMISIVFFILFTGFVMPRGEIPDYLIWVYWIDPLAWVLRALVVNEYRFGSFAECVYEGDDYCAKFGMTSGEYYLSLFGVPSEKHWVVLAFVFLASVYALCMMASCLVLEHVRYDSSASASTAVASHKQLGLDESSDEDTYVAAVTPRDADKPSHRAVTIDSPSTRRVVPVTVAFEDLYYSVPAPGSKDAKMIELLKGVSGYALPGTITALMGSTGAGKTTLMDVIAGRKQTGNSVSGVIEGKILLNGYAATPLAIQRCTGYCEQMDVHSEASTFREALTFSAFLRQDSDVSAHEKLATVTECLELLGLVSIADRVIRGSSSEQLKRLTIGVELAARPSVLFLDEPTSGLDARSAKLIMDGVRKVANTGRTIVCTIHQPSAEVFKVFDNLLLLKLGGEAVYFGELGRDCRSLVDYFEAFPGVEKLPEGYNPATWMLECIGAGVGHTPTVVAEGSAADFAGSFRHSHHQAMLTEMLTKQGVGCPSPDFSEMLFTRKCAASSMVQMNMLIRRFVDQYWRTPSYNLTRLGVYAMMALVFGVLFLGIDYKNYQGINGGLGVVSLTVIFSGFMSFNSVLPVTMQERAAYYRERAAQTYSALWYFVGATVVEIPYVFVLGLVFTAIFFPMVGFTGGETFVLFWLNTALLMLQQTYLGQLLAYTMPSLEVAALLGATVNSILMMFVGFNPPAASIPAGYRWLYWLTPQHYTMAILSTLVFGECDELPVYNETLNQYVGVSDDDALGCQPLRNVPLSIGHSTVKEYLENTFEMKRDELWTNFAITIAFTIFFRILALAALRFVNHQKK
jgi:ABC-type multidrug transport system ATPase subunit/ABC-type multidrug transport system permease subunit